VASGSKNQRRLKAELDGNSWTVNELRAWLDDILDVGVPGTNIINIRYTGNRDVAGLTVLLPWKARDAGSSTDEPEEKGGDLDGETSP
jgi:hypothetical protein